MSEISTEGYMYIECIAMILYYWDLPEERRIYYTSIYREALNIAQLRTTITYPVLRELIAQDAIAFKVRGAERAIQPDNGLVSVLETIFKYTGDHQVDIIINTDVDNIVISTSTIINILSRLK